MLRSNIQDVHKFEKHDNISQELSAISNMSLHKIFYLELHVKTIKYIKHLKCFLPLRHTNCALKNA